MATVAFDCGDPNKNHGTALDVSAQEFVNHLGLPTVHPLCCDSSKDIVDYDDEIITATTMKKKTELDYILARINDGSIFELPNLLVDGTASSSATMNTPSHTTIPPPPPPKVGPVPLLELHNNSIYELLLTLTAMTSSSIAMIELWARFVAIFICPVCTCYLIHCEIANIISSSTVTTARPVTTAATKTTTTKAPSKSALMISVLGLSSSIVIFTDSLYVYEYGRRFGCSLLILSSILAIRCATSLSSSSSVLTILHRCTISVLIVVAIVIYLQSDGNTRSNINRTTIASAVANMTPYSILTSTIKNPLQQISHPGIDLPTFNDGLYYSKSNKLIQSIISHWPKQSRTYTTTNGGGGATPYLVNGDQRTGIPFIVNKVTPQEYVRVYVQNMFDDEYLALDIAFPYKFSYTNNHTINTTTSDDTTNDTVVQLFIHDITKPVYLLLHGLNGGSHEQYVMDMVHRRRNEGSTVIVFIARGMMDTTITTWNTFHGARTGDIDIVARLIRAGLDSLAIANNVLSNQRQLLAGVGYSMGAIILSNYVSRSGNHCALDTAMAISGGLDMRQQINAKRSIRLWQPILTLGLRQDILLGKYGRHYKSRLSKEQMFGLLRATSISELDVEAIVTYNSFTSLIHYYSEMSAMGDREPEFNLFGPTPTTVSSSSSNEWGRIGNVSIPFVVLQALDDPIVGWRTVGTSNPQSLVDSGLGNVILLLTKAGGHVGWPIGLNPAVSSWQWMNNAARDFVIATDIARSEI